LVLARDLAFDRLGLPERDAVLRNTDGLPSHVRPITMASNSMTPNSMAPNSSDAKLDRHQHNDTNNNDANNNDLANTDPC